IFAIARALVASRAGHEDAYAASIKSALAHKSRLYEIGVYDLAPAQSGVPAGQQSMSPQSNPVCRREVKMPATLAHVSMSWWLVPAAAAAGLSRPAALPAGELAAARMRVARGTNGAGSRVLSAL